jgi:hypothetical protein
MIELDDPFAPSELHGFEGSLFDLKEMERLRAAYMQGCWFWHDDYLSVLHREPPIAESEIIEQAKEEAFLAWGL